jgi:hypothetical protein
VFAWWCLVLWLWLICFFVLIVGVLWVFYLRLHQFLSWVLLLYLTPPCFPLSFYPIHWRMSEDQSLEATTSSITRNLQAYAVIDTWKKLKKDDLFSFSTPCYSTSYHNLITITTTKRRWILYQEFYLLFNLFILVIFWSWSLPTNQMEKGNQDNSNDDSYNLGYDQYVSPYPNPEDTHTKF